MKKLLVFLHCKGGNKTKSADFAHKTAKKMGCNLLIFDAPFTYSEKDGTFIWFHKDNNGLAKPQDVQHSISYVISKIKNSGYQMQDVILCGHSQGGAMAAIIGMSSNPYAVISICGDLPINLNYIPNQSNNTNFYWIEASQDTYLTNARKNTYNTLKNNHYNLKYIKAPNSTHFDYASDVWTILEKENLCEKY